MNELTFNESLMTLTVKACLIALLALGFSIGLKRKEASVRSQIWSFASIMLLTFPLASILLPNWELPFLDPKVVNLDGSENQTQSFSFLIFLWLLGSSVLLIRLIANMYHLNQLQKSCQPVKNIKWLEISKQVSKSLKIKRKITLLQSDQVTMPMTWGFFRPYVLIPSSGERWNIHRKKMVLMHEFEHIYRCDWMIQILSSLAVALHWFNPLSWVVSFMIKLEREKACDDAVLRSGISPTDYATTLLLFAKNKKTSSTMGIACALQLITGNQLQSRIQSILNGGVGRKRISKSLWAVLSLTVILTILPIASAHSPVELIQKLECFPEEEYVASELNIMITPAKLNLSEKGKNLQPALKKDSKKPCRKHKCDKSKKGQPTNPKTTKPVILEA
jgi:beta-lactamase regulating signal transducer with metallopeptidase domain